MDQLTQEQSAQPQTGPSRRQVLRGLAAGAAVVGFGSLLASCSRSEAPSGTGTPAPNLFEQPEIGFAMGDSLFFTPDAEATDKTQMSFEEISERLGKIKKLGATAIRVDFDGNLFQQNGLGDYDWSFSDNIMKAAVEHGLEVLATITYWPTADQVPAARKVDPESYTGMPDSPTAFGRFAGAVATRYLKAGLNRFEIWNEENTAIGGADPALYARVVAAAARAIKAVNKKASVSLGALAETPKFDGAVPPVQFLDATLSELGDDISLLNAIAVNAYTAPATADQPENWDLFTAIEGPIPPEQPGQPSPPTIHDIMVKHGIGKLPVLITEMGAPTEGTGVEATVKNQQWNDYDSKPNPYVSEGLQEEIISDELTHRFKLANVTQRFVYTAFKGAGNSPLENFGLIDQNGTVTSSGNLFRRFAAAFRQRTGK